MLLDAISHIPCVFTPEHMQLGSGHKGRLCLTGSRLWEHHEACINATFLFFSHHWRFPDVSYPRTNPSQKCPPPPPPSLAMSPLSKAPTTSSGPHLSLVTSAPLVHGDGVLWFVLRVASSSRACWYSQFLFAGWHWCPLHYTPATIWAGAVIGAGTGDSSGVGAHGAGGGAGSEAEGASGHGAAFNQSWSRWSASSSMSGLARHMISTGAGISPTGPGLGGGTTPTGLRWSSWLSSSSWRCSKTRPTHCPSTVGAFHGADSTLEMILDSSKVTWQEERMVWHSMSRSLWAFCL